MSTNQKNRCKISNEKEFLGENDSDINIDENFDVYPGLSLGLKNFGGHLGARYFFSEGFGVYTELNVPFAKYKSETLTAAETLHNQFTVNFGATFNL